MSRRKKGDIVNGWINLDKPAGMTSTEAVNRVRRLYNAQKAGHAGTLDPLATGILPIALGEGTKTIPWCQDRMKIYTFSVIWGEERNTDDAEGVVIATSPVRPTEAQIRAVLPRFTGDIEQIPPQFSAIKIGGERAYDLARAGETVEIAARTVTIETLDLIETTPDFARFRVLCGKGTYMRSLARDMARALGTVGYIADLRREAVGSFAAEDAISLEFLENLAQSARLDEGLLPVEAALDDIPALDLNEREATRLKNGQSLSFIARPDVDRLQRIGVDLKQMALILTVFEGLPVAVAETQGANIQPLRLFNL